MKVEPSQNLPPSATKAHGRIAALARQAGAIIIWERMWPPILWALTIAAIFVAISWLGFWLEAPIYLRPIGVAFFVGLALYALSPLLRQNWPTRAQVLARLDRDAGVAHRPASAHLDVVIASQDEARTQALWALHQRQVARRVDAIRAAPPSPDMPRHDHMALRFGAVLLAVAAAFAAGPERGARLASAFDWRSGSAEIVGARIDAWIDPPAYSGDAPIILDVSPSMDVRNLTAPAGSILVVKSAAANFSATVSGALTPLAAADAKGAAAPSSEQRWRLNGEAGLNLQVSGAPLARYAFSSVANTKPSIELTEPPGANARGSLTLKYRASDQYGLASAAGEITLNADGSGAPVRRTLVEPPKIALRLPATAAGIGEAQTTIDLSDHGWAGSKVWLRLRAIDLAGETGQSAAVEIILPQRRFFDPLARALAEQRRDLVMDPDANRAHIAMTLDALQIAPDSYEIPANVYLGLRHGGVLLAQARSDDELRDVAVYLWSMALQIEEGGASQAERDLRAAEQNLREAIQRGASDDELKKLMDELRSAAERFAQEMLKNNDPQADNSRGPTQDLNDMLDRMDDSLHNGSREKAQAMLDQLQNMFENMKSARAAPDDPASKAMRKEIGELERLLKEQQALRDDTFRSDEKDRKRGASPDSNSDQKPQGQGDEPSLAERQQQLQDRLRQLRQALKDQGQAAPKGLSSADREMGDAEDGLKPGAKGKPGASGKSGAVGAQGRAVQALRDGLHGMQQQMQGRNGQQGGVSAQGRQGKSANGRDPLGRGPSGVNGQAEGLLNGGVPAAERARRVMEELRRRLADPSRAEQERNYFDRLLKRE